MCEEFCPSFPREHPMWHSPICLFLPMPSSEYFCLFSSWCLHHSSTYGRSVLPACYLCMSTPIFASISASLSQTLSELLKCPSSGAHPTAPQQAPRMALSGILKGPVSEHRSCATGSHPEGKTWPQELAVTSRWKEGLITANVELQMNIAKCCCH